MDRLSVTSTEITDCSLSVIELVGSVLAGSNPVYFAISGAFTG